jgi:hypothetical protein
MTPVRGLGKNYSLVLHLHPVINLTDDQFFELWSKVGNSGLIEGLNCTRVNNYFFDSVS